MNWITPEEALKDSGLDPDTLYKLIADKAIPSVGEGENMRVLAEAVREVAQQINPANFDHLRGKKISASQAAARLGVRRSSVIDWAREGRITLLGQSPDGHREVYVDEADIERTARLIELSGKKQGRSVFPGGGRYGGKLLDRLRQAGSKE
jgi:DNA-binding transcriptional regulator YiaG